MLSRNDRIRAPASILDMAAPALFGNPGWLCARRTYKIIKRPSARELMASEPAALARPSPRGRRATWTPLSSTSCSTGRPKTQSPRRCRRGIPFGIASGINPYHADARWRTRPFIAKPYSMADVRDFLRRLLPGHVALQPCGEMGV